MDSLRQLKIKTASVKRIRKELAFYEGDAIKEQERLEKLKESGIDPHRLHQAENVLSEAKAMIPDSKQRLESAVRDLKTFLVNSLPCTEIEVVADARVRGAGQRRGSGGGNSIARRSAAIDCIDSPEFVNSARKC